MEIVSRFFIMSTMRFCPLPGKSGGHTYGLPIFKLLMHLTFNSCHLLRSQFLTRIRPVRLALHTSAPRQPAGKSQGTRLLRR